MSDGFQLTIIITDQQDGMLEEFKIECPANTVARAAAKVRDLLEKKFYNDEAGFGND